MADMSATTVLVLVVCAAFAIGALGNFFAPKPLRVRYRRWGYPNRFHLFTGCLETIAVALLAFPETRIFGVALGATIMIGAVGTLAIHRDFAHAVMPAVILAVTMALGAVTIAPVV